MRVRDWWYNLSSSFSKCLTIGYTDDILIFYAPLLGWPTRTLKTFSVQMPLHWRHVASPATRLIITQFVQDNNQWNIKAPHYTTHRLGKMVFIPPNAYKIVVSKVVVVLPRPSVDYYSFCGAPVCRDLYQSAFVCQRPLRYWGQDKMATILHTLFLFGFSSLYFDKVS